MRAGTRVGAAPYRSPHMLTSNEHPGDRTMRLPLRPVAIAVSALLVAACDAGDRAPTDAAAAGTAAPPTEQPPAAPPPSSAGSEVPAGIAWFAGSLDEAFAAARAAGEPVLLYWGAE